MCCAYSNRILGPSPARRRGGRKYPSSPEPDFDFKKFKNENLEDLESLLQKNQVDVHEDNDKSQLLAWKASVKSTAASSRSSVQMTTSSPDIIFPGGQRRGINVEEENDGIKNGSKLEGKEAAVQSFFAHHDHVLVGPHGYDKGLCATLRVPCRFVNDHPCCKYEMPLDLVARARSLDGSADLKWRPKSLGGPRTASGRSLSMRAPTLASTVLNTKIQYNYALNKRLVQIPTYHYDGGPEMTSTIVGLCWRLHYLRCPSTENANSQEKIHPCCQLLSKPSEIDPLKSRISKWLYHVQV